MINKKTGDAPSVMAGALTPGPPVDSTAASRHEVRLGRVYEYLTDSLQQEYALEANLGSVNCGLMQMGIWLDEAIEKDIASGPLSVDRLKRLSPAIETCLKVTR